MSEPSWRGERVRFDGQDLEGLASLLRSRWCLRVPAASHFLAAFASPRPNLRPPFGESSVMEPVGSFRS